MPKILWSIDGQDLVLTDRGTVGISITWPGQPAIPIPSRTLGEWPLAFPQRDVVLRTVRNLDVVRFQLWSDGYHLPRTKTPLRPNSAPPESRCATHPESAATCQCLRCGTFACRSCAPDGARCRDCLTRLIEDEFRQAQRLRWIGLAASIALGLVLAAVGRWAGWPRVFTLGVATCALTGFLWVRGLLAERREARQGRGPRAPLRAARRP